MSGNVTTRDRGWVNLLKVLVVFLERAQVFVKNEITSRVFLIFSDLITQSC
jgi:hypothetical protein